MNKAVIILFSIFLLIVFFSSLQKAPRNHKAASTQSAPTIILVLPTATPAPTAAQPLLPTPTMLPVAHPQFRINRNFGDD